MSCIWKQGKNIASLVTLTIKSVADETVEGMEIKGKITERSTGKQFQKQRVQSKFKLINIFLGQKSAGKLPRINALDYLS